jgi:hypothetical protein
MVDSMKNLTVLLIPATSSCSKYGTKFKFVSYEQRSSSLAERNSSSGLLLYRYVSDIEVPSGRENLLDIPSSD